MLKDTSRWATWTWLLIIGLRLDLHMDLFLGAAPSAVGLVVLPATLLGSVSTSIIVGYTYVHASIRPVELVALARTHRKLCLFLGFVVNKGNLLAKRV
jgi:hypothetical protein